MTRPEADAAGAMLGQATRTRMARGLPAITGTTARTRARQGCQRDHPGAPPLVMREKAGHAPIGARRWIPADHIADPVSSLVMGLLPGLAFGTKGRPGHRHPRRCAG